MHNTSRNVVVATLMFMLMAGANAAHATVELVQFSVKEGKSFVCKGRSILPEDFYILTDPAGHEGEVSVSIPGTTTVGSKIATATLNNKTLPATYEVVTEHTEQLQTQVVDESFMGASVVILDTNSSDPGIVSGNRYFRYGTVKGQGEAQFATETGFSTCGGGVAMRHMSGLQVGGSVTGTLGAVEGGFDFVWNKEDTITVSQPATLGRKHNIKVYDQKIKLTVAGHNNMRQALVIVLGVEVTGEFYDDTSPFSEEHEGWLSPLRAVETRCCDY